MFKIIKALGLRQEFEKIKLLFFLHFGLMIFGYLLNIFDGNSFGWKFLYLLILLYVYKMAHGALERLFYSFWTFGLFLSLNTLYYFFDSLGSDSGATKSEIFYGLSFLMFIILSYKLSSPVYYPRVSWWEYDFRYRGDLSIMIKRIFKRGTDNTAESSDTTLSARLTDLRRQAGCVVCFQSLNIGENFTVEYQIKGRPITLRAYVVSKRELLIGRGLTYGVKFILDDDEDLKDYERFVSYWKKNKSAKLRLKFEKSLRDR